MSAHFMNRSRLRLFTALLCWIAQEAMPDHPIRMEMISTAIATSTALEISLMYLMSASVQLHAGHAGGDSNA